jgi:hypothetical protein
MSNKKEIYGPKAQQLLEQELARAAFEEATECKNDAKNILLLLERILDKLASIENLLEKMVAKENSSSKILQG